MEVTLLGADEIEMTPRSPAAFKPLALRDTPPAISVTPQLTISPVISNVSHLTRPLVPRKRSLQILEYPINS